jgi:hypothetical protein
MADEVALTADTNDFLRNKLNIKSLGERYAMRKGICYLQLRSQRSQASASDQIKTVAEPPS